MSPVIAAYSIWLPLLLPGQVAVELKPEKAGTADAPRQGENGETETSPILADKPASQSDSGPHQHQPTQGPNEPDERWTRKDALAALFNAGLVLTAIAQCVLLYLHFKVMIKALEATRGAAQAAIDAVDHMRFEQRAWFCCRAPAVHWNGILPPKIDVAIYNSGRTPGTIVRELVRWSICSADTFAAEIHRTIADMPHIARSTGLQRIIAPDSTLAMAEHPLPPSEWKPELAVAVSNGEARFYLVIFIEYQDVFGLTHTTLASYVYDPGRQQLLAHDTGNQMT